MAAAGERWLCRSPLPAHLVLIKDVEDKRGELGGVPEGEELLVDLLEAGSIQLPTGAIFDEAFIPAGGRPGELGNRCQPHPPARSSG